MQKSYKQENEQLKFALAQRDNQLNELIAQRDKMRTERDEANGRARVLEEQVRGAESIAEALRLDLVGLEKAYARLQGWQDCMREAVGSTHNETPKHEGLTKYDPDLQRANWREVHNPAARAFRYPDVRSPSGYSS